VGVLLALGLGVYFLDARKEPMVGVGGVAWVGGGGGPAPPNSAVVLVRLHDPKAITTTPLEPPVQRLLAAARASRWRVAVFITCFMFGANIAIPFFAPYMLRTLQLDFVGFMSLSAVAIAAKAVAFPLWSRAAQRIGLRGVLLAGTLGTSLVAAWWGSIHSLVGLHLVQTFSGVAWSAYELAGLQLLLRSAPEEHRESFFSVQAPLTSLAQVAGGLCGAFLLARVDAGYEVAFVASSFMRALPCALLLGPVVQALQRTPLPRVFFRGMSMRPDGGVMRAPILAPTENSATIAAAPASDRAPHK
jgi:hypothetical protein